MNGIALDKPIRVAVRLGCTDYMLTREEWERLRDDVEKRWQLARHVSTDVYRLATALDENPGATSKDLFAATGINLHQIQVWLSRWKRHGFVVAEGTHSPWGHLMRWTIVRPIEFTGDVAHNSGKGRRYRERRTTQAPHGDEQEKKGQGA